MAQYEHLPIYREAFKFLIYCETSVQHFLRYHKYMHGSDLRDTARAVIKLIIRGNNLSEKDLPPRQDYSIKTLVPAQKVDNCYLESHYKQLRV